MKYVKLVARKDTWFKEGLEVFDYDSDYSNKKRILLTKWEEAVREGVGIYARGIRVCEDNRNENGNGWKAGEERGDGEWCSLDEFDVEVTDEPIGE